MDLYHEIAKNIPSTEELLRAIGAHSSRNSGSDLLPSVALFGAGLLVGAGLALLLAPTSGRELREDLSGMASDLRDRAAHTIGTAVEDENGGRASHEVA
jgi:hypothetical protein